MKCLKILCYWYCFIELPTQFTEANISASVKVQKVSELQNTFILSKCKVLNFGCGCTLSHVWRMTRSFYQRCNARWGCTFCQTLSWCRQRCPSQCCTSPAPGSRSVLELIKLPFLDLVGFDNLALDFRSTILWAAHHSIANHVIIIIFLLVQTKCHFVCPLSYAWQNYRVFRITVPQ